MVNEEEEEEVDGVCQVATALRMTNDAAKQRAKRLQVLKILAGLDYVMLQKVTTASPGSAWLSSR